MPQIINVPGHGQVSFPDGMTDDQIVSAIKANTPEQPGIGQQLARQVGLTARAGAQGVLGIPAAIGDALGFPSSQAVNNVLDMVGLPSPQNATERFANAVASGMAIPGSVAQVLPQLGERIGTQILSSGAASGSSDLAREAGLGPLAQMGAGLVGGVALPTTLAAATTALKAGGRAAGSLVAPLTQQGRMNIAAKAMQGNASSPASAAENIGAAPQYIPGVAPTTAEVAGDSGIASLYKALRNQAPAPFTDREVANDAARQAFLARQFGNSNDLKVARAARETATAGPRDSALAAANANTSSYAQLSAEAQAAAQSRARALQEAGQLRTTAAQQQALADSYTPVPGMPRVAASISNNIERVPEYASGAADADIVAAQREAQRAFAESQLNSLSARATPLTSAPIISAIDSGLNTPGLRASDVVRGTLADVKNKIASLTRSDGTIDARDLYTVRKEIGNTIKQYAKDSNNWDKRLTSGLESGIQGQIDSAIVNAGGSMWPEYLRTYADMSRGIGAKQLGQEITAGSTNPLTERLSPAQFTRAFQNNAEDVANAGATTSDALYRTGEDLRRSVGPSLAMKTAGSDTLQNMVGNDMVQRAIGRVPGGITTKALSKVASFIYSPAEQQTRDMLMRGMLDPQFGQMLLTRQIAQRPDLIRGLLGLRQPIAMGGLLGTVGAQ